MTAHGPDERLSAFYDGELSGAERADVERLVTERPELRAELSQLAGLSQRLSDLADDLPEVDLRSHVMQRIAAARPAPPRSLVPSGVAGVLTPRRRWMPLVLTACSLALLVAAVWPLLPLSDRVDLVANNESPRRSSTDWMGGDPSISEESGLATPSLIESGEKLQVAAHDFPMTLGLPPVEVLGNAASGGRDSGAAGAPSDGTGPSEFLASLVRRRDLKPGDIVSRLIEGGDVPMIADYTVVDVLRTANHFEFLLQEHGIVPLRPTAEKKKSGSGDTHSRKSADSDMRVFIVEAESTSLNTALIQCQNLKDVVGLNVEPLGYGESEAQLASRAAHQNPAAEPPSPSAPALPIHAKPSAVASAGASPPAAAHNAASEVVAGKGGPANYQAKSRGQLDDQADATNRVNKKMADAPQEKSILGQIVNGNSLFIENGDELFTEIRQHQVPLRMRAASNSPSPQGLGQNIDKQPFTQPGQKTESVESIFAKGQATPALGNLNGDHLQYGNNYSDNGYRNRQRAIVVLRTQSPPPPPEPTSIKP